MGLLSLTKDGVSFLLDENDITRVYSLDGVVKVEYLKANGGTLDTITVEESLATIDAASDELIELTSNGVAFLLNYTIIRQVLTEGSGSKVIYEKLQTQSVVVEETPTEINALINPPSTEPLTYKALLSQNAPIPSQTSGIFTVGQIWTITTFVAGDDFSNMELISGTMNTTGAVIRATSDTPTIWTNSSDLAYDGSPYIVSTDSNGDFAPFVNTLSGYFRYDVVGNYTFISNSSNLTIDKTIIKPIISYSNLSPLNSQDIYSAGRNSDTEIYISTAMRDNTSGATTSGDDILYYTPFEIEVYP